MAGTSERIIILSALLLAVIIIWSPHSELLRTISTVNDIEVEIGTSRDNYTRGESFTATVYFLNNGTKDLWMDPIYEVSFLGNSLNDPEPNSGVILIDWVQGAMIHVPAKSKIKLFERDFESQYSGEFLITCLDAKKTVLIIECEYAGANNNNNESHYVDIGILDLKVQPDRDEYYLREPALVSIYLVNPYPYRITVENVVGYVFSGEAEYQIGTIVGFIEFNPEGEPITMGPHSELLIGMETMTPWRTGNFTFHATVEPLRASYTVQVHAAPPPKKTGTLKDVDVEICTQRENYTLGEIFAAIVYLVNNGSEDVWIEAVSHYTVNSYSLSHPEEGLSADVHVTIDVDNPWIYIPANSRIEFDYIFCKPQCAGEYRISCLGAEKTVLILEPDIQPYENTTSSNGTTAASGPLGDLSRLNLTMNCDLPPTLEYVPRLKIERIPITNSTAEEIALNAFNFSDIDKIEITSMGSLAVIEGNKRLYFYGLNDIFYLTLRDKTVVEEWSEPEIRTIADEFLENLYNYWQVPTEAHIEFDTIRPCYVTVHEDGTRVVNKIGAFYSVKVAGINLYGPGADFRLSIADGLVFDVELHIPSLFIEGYTDLPLSPQEALERFLAGNYSTEELGFTTLYGVIPREGQLTIEKVELVYFIDHHADPPQTYPPLCYMISGTIIGPDPLEDEIKRIDFHELIPIT